MKRFFHSSDFGRSKNPTKKYKQIIEKKVIQENSRDIKGEQMETGIKKVKEYLFV